MQVAPSGGHASSATWWQNWNQCKLHCILAKFGTIASGIVFSWRDSWRVWGNFLGRNLLDFGGLNPCLDGLGHFFQR